MMDGTLRMSLKGMYHNRINCNVVAKGIASNKLFKTKKELLESL